MTVRFDPSLAAPPEAFPPAAPSFARTMARLLSWGIGLALTVFTWIDLLGRPTFRPLGIESTDFTHEAPPIVGQVHSVAHLLMMGCAIAVMAVSRADFRRVGGFAAALLGYFLIAALSVGASQTTSLKEVAFLVLMAITMLGTVGFAATDHAEDQGYAQVFAATCLGLVTCLIGALVVGEYTWGRLASRAGPNFWGPVAFTVFVASFTFRRMSVRIPFILLGIAVILLCSSRGSLMGLVASATALFAIRFRFDRAGWLAVLLVGVLAAGAVLIVLTPTILDVLHVNDAGRGIGSGGTGRALAWAEAWQMFVDHPFLGVGYRQHEQFITIATSAHDIYLATLAELGAGGLALYLILFLGGAIRGSIAAIRTRRLDRAVAAATLWGYLVIGIVENFGFGAYLPVSLFATFALGLAWRPVSLAEEMAAHEQFVPNN